MKQKEIREKTGLTRKAIAYYEEKGLIAPRIDENGHRYYSEEDLAALNTINLYRKLGLSTAAIKDILHQETSALAPLARNLAIKADIDEKKRAIIAMIIEGQSAADIEKALQPVENMETIAQKLQQAFPGYFGQMLYYAYRPYLDEPIREGEQAAFDAFIRYHDGLPPLELTENEIALIDKLTAPFDSETLKAIQREKQNAIEAPKQWLDNSREAVEAYMAYKNSDVYQMSELKTIEDKWKTYLSEHDYHGIAFPLIRRFSQSYDDYIEKLTLADREFRRVMDEEAAEGQSMGHAY